MKNLLSYIFVGIVSSTITLIATNMPGQMYATGDRIDYVMLDGDTLDVSEQEQVEEFAQRAARIAVRVLNQYGSNSAHYDRKNWGAIHVYDDGTPHSCGYSSIMTGDYSFGLHIVSEGAHSSAIKIGMDGDNPNHRGLNVLMPDGGTYNSQTGILVRNFSGEGVPIALSSINADRYIKMDNWELRIDEVTDELLFYYEDQKVAGIETDGTYNIF